MPKAIQPITLSEAEQTELRLLINQGVHSARMIKRAQILLHSHAGKKPQEIASWLDTCLGTVYNVRANVTRPKAWTVRCTRNRDLASRSN